MNLLKKAKITQLQVVIGLLLSMAARAQTVRGRVTDAASGRPIRGVSIVGLNTQTGTTTDANGSYSLRLSPGSHTLRYSFVGYETRSEPVQIQDETTVSINISLTESRASLNEVIVVGSRAQTARTNIQTPVPVDVIGSKELKAYAQTDLSQILNYAAPSFSSNRQTVSDGTDHIDPASLRGLGPDQVLVLVNGKRRHTTALVNINGTFGRGTVGTDLNAIPVAAIERIEVLRDGAAAQYGSDAIAGVINVVLKKETPWAASLQYGQHASHTLGRHFNDGATTQFDLSKGFRIGRRGSISFGAQYLDRGATNRGGIDTRPLLYSNLPTRGANESETDFGTRYRVLKADDDARAQAAGLDRNNMRVGNAAVRNLGFLVNGAFGIEKTAEVYFQTGFTDKQGKAAGFYRLPSQSTQVDLTLYPNGFLPFIHTGVQDLSASAGLRGLAGGWHYDLSNTFGQNRIRFDITNTVNASLPTGTSPTEFYAGTLRFAQNTINADVSKRHEAGGILTALNTAFGAEFRIDSYEIQAGDELSYSFGQPSQGIEGRKIGTAFTAAGAQVFPGFKPANALTKSRNNQGLYADLEAEFGPRFLLGVAGRYENYSDFGHNFSYKATGRFTVYKAISIRGAVATGFRAPSLHQRFFNNESTQFVNNVPRQILTVNNDNGIVRQFGVGSLKPELATSYSLGLAGQLGKTVTFTVDAYEIAIKDRIVFSSQFVRETAPTGTVNTILNTVDPNQQINSVQFFTNAISTRTQGLDVVLTDRIRIARNSLTLSAAANFNQTKVTQIKGSSTLETNPDLRARLFDRTEQSRFESSVPKSKINLSGGLTTGKWDFLIRALRFGEVTFLSTTDPFTTDGKPRIVDGVPYPTENDQTFSAKWVTDLTVTYRFLKTVSATLGATNLFDVYPDRAYLNPRNSETNLTGDPATRYSGNLDNTSNGRFLYSRTVTQFGFNGRFLFGRINLTF
ncbi:TonB-dependent receptor [Larkinella knui]|uniref:TonB-dependent receptor n=1 Tax=Larkinella knui TaxID=2025310 RepID=A0A3P1CVB7_9BACT|nr:TonB-dependent receptor [Larkinella knui]RRB17221.1 TonB-dependent receptor [Larkinella knui]